MRSLRAAREALCLVSTVAIFTAGCGGHAANPVDRYMLGDEKKSCEALYAEMAQIDEDIVLKNKEKDNRDVTNIVCFVAGIFIIVPFFFMDVKGSQEVEIDALRSRKNALQIIFTDKGCTPPEVKPPEAESKKRVMLCPENEVLPAVSSAATLAWMPVAPSRAA
jgi:hypothetical protein